MGFKVAIKKRIKICYLSLKCLKLYYFIPLLFIYILVPLLDLIQIKTVGFNDFDLHVRANTQMFLPLFASWWIIFMLWEYIEGEGNEVLYCHGKVKVSEVLIVFAIYIIHTIPLYVVYSFYLDNMMLEFTRIIIQCFFFASLVYFLMYLTSSSAITLMSVITYHITVNFYTQSKIITNISIYDYIPMSLDLFLHRYLPVLLISTIFLVIGVLRNRSFYR